MSKKIKALGKGLSALLPDKQDVSTIVVGDAISNNINEVAVSKIFPNPAQPRKNFTSEALNELSQSIKEHGVLQPVVVRPINNGKFEIVAGERRWRASKQAGLKNIPVIIRTLTDQEAMQIAIIENIQREELNPLEEAEAFQKLIKEYSMTQEEMGLKVGKSRPYIANSLRLLGLNQIVRSMLVDGKITAGHARAIVTLDEEDQINITQRIITENLSVRQTEQLINKRNKPKPLALKRKQDDADIKSFEDNLRTIFGTRVAVKQNEKGGLIEIHYYDNDDLLRISEIILENKNQ